MPTHGRSATSDTISRCCDYTIEWQPVGRKKLIHERCVNGYWVYDGYSCSGQNCGGSCPL